MVGRKLYSRSTKWKRAHPNRSFEIAEPGPDEPTYTVAELMGLTRVSRRTILNWVRAGLVPKPFFRGPKTRYRRQHLVYILAAKKARGDYLSMQETGRMIAKSSYDELERYVGLATVAPSVEKDASAAAVERYPGAPEWHFVELMPGLELYVRNEPLVRRIAHAIIEQYGIGS